MAKNYRVLSEVVTLINKSTGYVTFGFTFAAITFLCKFLKEFAGSHYMSKARDLLFFAYFNVAILSASRGHKKVSKLHLYI